jgi:uncharacterized protein YkwD
MIAPVEDMKKSSIQMFAWQPRHPSLLSPSRSALKKRCEKTTARVPVPFSPLKKSCKKQTVRVPVPFLNAQEKLQKTNRPRACPLSPLPPLKWNQPLDGFS